MREFKVCRGYENEGVILPERKTANSAGYDIRIIEDLTINPGEIVAAKTGVKAYMEKDEVLNLYLRSSIGLKMHLLIPNSVGIIDADYFENPENDGHIFVTLYNFGKSTVSLKKGERIAQAVFLKFLKTSNEKEIIAKRSGGFGSTGKE